MKFRAGKSLADHETIQTYSRHVADTLGIASPLKLLSEGEKGCLQTSSLGYASPPEQERFLRGNSTLGVYAPLKKGNQ